MNLIFKNVVVFLFIPLLFVSTYASEGKSKMEYMYDYDAKDIHEIKPQIYKLYGSTRLMLFSLPFDNSVGTNNYRNALTVISFPGGKINMEHYFKRSVDSIEASGIYLPLINDRLVGFGQTRRFLLFDFKRNTYDQYRIAFSTQQSIFNIAVSDPDNRKFIFEIESFTSKPGHYSIETAHSLQLIDLSGKEVKLLKELPMIKSGSTWVKAYDRVFEWGFAAKIMKVYDLNLEPARHPLADLILKNTGITNFVEMLPHPTLPFAILDAGGKEGVSCISWDNDRAKILKRLLEDGGNLAFSSDGKWVTFQWGAFRNKKTYLMPVSEKYPNFLGSPILIHDGYFEKVNTTWTKNPTSFVGNDRRNLYRWELTKEAQRSMMGNDADKYQTFHDYIVAKDLEKLTKEKKQGLGK